MLATSVYIPASSVNSLPGCLTRTASIVDNNSNRKKRITEKCQVEKDAGDT